MTIPFCFSHKFLVKGLFREQWSWWNYSLMIRFYKLCSFYVQFLYSYFCESNSLLHCLTCMCLAVFKWISNLLLRMTTVMMYQLHAAMKPSLRSWIQRIDSFRKISGKSHVTNTVQLHSIQKHWNKEVFAINHNRIALKVVIIVIVIVIIFI